MTETDLLTQYKDALEWCDTWLIWLNEFVATKDWENLTVDQDDLDDALELKAGLRKIMETVWADDEDLWKEEYWKD